ncbi:MAG: sugar phosphate isomerase/epimerase [Clostridia bacterium]|nr:sugar phosphate isomerase/epimerase [Clostridia bacterium]
MFKLGIITDELSQDLDEALAFSKKMGLECFELRSAWDRAPFTFTHEDWQTVKALADKYSLPCLSVSSPLFKCDYFDRATVEGQIRDFEKMAEEASAIGVKMVRTFDFFKDERVTLDMVREAYQPVIEIANKYGITLMIEPEPTANSSTCSATAATVRYIDNPTVKALYDPGNVLFADTTELPYPDAYEAMADIYCHVHIKDAVMVDGKPECLAIGHGIVGYENVFRRLLSDGYESAVMLEPHYKIGAKLTEEQMQRPGGSSFSDGGLLSGEEAITETKKIINKILNN